MHHTNSVGIDVSKQTLDVALLPGSRAAGRTFTNTPAGSAALTAYLKAQGVDHSWACILESTGALHLLTSLTLTTAGFTVYVINPIITKRYQKASIRDAKTDTIDATRLAKIGLTEEGLMPFRADLQAISAKKALSLLHLLERVRQQLKTSLTALHDTEAVLGINLPGSYLDEIMIHLTEQIEELRAYLVRQTKVEGHQFVKHVAGVSATQMAVLAAATATSSFANRDQLVAFCGLDVRARQSGAWQGKQRLSKRGNPYLRKVLFQIAWGLRLHNDVYRQYYDGLRARDLDYRSAMIAVARKFLRFYFAYHWRGTVTFPQTTP